MLDKQRPLNGIRFVKINLAPQLRRYMARVFIIGVLAQNCNFALREGVYYLVDYGGLTASGATGYTDD
jgi:hypothetical protein